MLPNKSHALCWNPTEPINFTVGSDDANAYSFDMRNMKEAKFIHKVYNFKSHILLII